MSSITQVPNLKRNSWRAFVFKSGQRLSKCFPTREEAQVWADHQEKKLEALRSRYQRGGQPPALATYAPTKALTNPEMEYTYDDILAAVIPYGSTSGIYFLTRGTKIVYIGQSTGVLRRIMAHRVDGKDFDGFAFFSCPEEDLDELETAYIRAFNPSDNWSFGNRPGRKRRHRPSTSSPAED